MSFDSLPTCKCNWMTTRTISQFGLILASRQRRVPRSDATVPPKYVFQIVSGVGYAHNQHICHRDMKLDNVLLSRPGCLKEIKLADFGLSDFYRPGATMRTNCGSISYLAPEVSGRKFEAKPKQKHPELGYRLGRYMYSVTWPVTYLQKNHVGRRS